MTIKMRLDTAGLRALIAENPELEVEIGQEVLKNIRDDVVGQQVSAAVTRITDQVVRGMVEREGGYYSQKYVVKDPNVLKAIQDAVAAISVEAVTASVESTAATAVGKIIAREKEVLREEMRTRLRELLTPEMARKILMEKIL